MLRLFVICFLHSLVPRLSPSFPSLVVRYCKRGEAGRGPGNEATFDNREANKDGFLYFMCITHNVVEGRSGSQVCPKMNVSTVHR